RLLAPMQGQHLRLGLTVSQGSASLLSQVVRPRVDDKALHIPVGSFQFAVQTPETGTVPASLDPYCVDALQELLTILFADLIGNLDGYGTVLGLQLREREHRYLAGRGCNLSLL